MKDIEHIEILEPENPHLCTKEYGGPISIKFWGQRSRVGPSWSDVRRRLNKIMRSDCPPTINADLVLVLPCAPPPRGEQRDIRSSRDK